MSPQSLLSQISDLELLMRSITSLYRNFPSLDNRDLEELVSSMALLKLVIDTVVPLMREFVKDDEALAMHFEQKLFAIGVERFLDEIGVPVIR
jgi:hypothetical protein